MAHLIMTLVSQTSPSSQLPSFLPLVQPRCHGQPFRSSLSTLCCSYLGASLCSSRPLLPLLRSWTLLEHHRDWPPESRLPGKPFLHFPFISSHGQYKPCLISSSRSFLSHNSHIFSPSHLRRLRLFYMGSNIPCPHLKMFLYCHLFSFRVPDHPLTFTHHILK